MSDRGSLPIVPDAGQVRAHRTAWIVVAAIGVVSLAPTLALRGMSLDGVVYATIARNLAVGLGDTWHPVYASPSATFYEHPPLGFWLQSHWFRVLGDQWWVERLYSGLTAVPMAVLIVLLWRQFCAGAPAHRKASWLPVVLWVLMPAWTWIYRNNFLENTLGVFALLSVYASVRAMTGSRHCVAWCVVAAAGVVAAVLTKGPVGLFPLVTPCVYWLATREVSWRRCLAVQAGLCMSVFVIGLALAAAREPREFFLAYVPQQVFDSVQGHRETTPSRLGRLSLLAGLIQDLWLTVGIAGLLVLLTRRQTSGQRLTLVGPARFCLAMALCASLPIMISPKQTNYYTAPSWPLYALALACWSSEAVRMLVAHAVVHGTSAAWQRWLRRGAVAGLVFCFALSPLWYGGYLRDRSLITDVDRIAEVVGPHQRLDIGPKLARHWALHAYLFRRHYISVECDCGSADYRLDVAESGDSREVRAATVQLASFVLSRRQPIAVAAAPDEP